MRMLFLDKENKNAIFLSTFHTSKRQKTNNIHICTYIPNEVNELQVDLKTKQTRQKKKKEKKKKSSVWEKTNKQTKQTNKNRKWLDLALLLFSCWNNDNWNGQEFQPRQNVETIGPKEKDVTISRGMTFKFWQKRRRELKRRHCIFNISILTDSFSCFRSCLTHGDIQFTNVTSPSLLFYAPLSVPLTDTDRQIYTQTDTRAHTNTRQYARVFTLCCITSVENTSANSFRWHTYM